MTSLFVMFIVSNAKEDISNAADNNNGDDTIEMAVGGQDGMRRSSVLPETSLFFVFDFVGDWDAIFDAADKDNRDTAGQNTPDDQEDTADVVQGKGDNLEMIRTIPLDKFIFSDYLIPTYHRFFHERHHLWRRLVTFCHGFDNECCL